MSEHNNRNKNSDRTSHQRKENYRENVSSQKRHKMITIELYCDKMPESRNNGVKSELSLPR
jgi:hypothetical protein